MHKVSGIFVSQMAIRDEILLSALKEVLNRSNSIIKNFDGKYGRKLKKLRDCITSYVLENSDNSKNDSLSDIVREAFKENESKYFSKYYEACSLVKRINSDVILIKNEMNNVQDSDICLTSDLMSNVLFIKSVVPQIFELQYICFDLMLACEGLNPIDYPEGINPRKVIAKSGGVAKNYGIRVLQDLVLNKINEIEVKEKFANKNNFFEKNEHYFLGVLENYQKNFLGKRDSFDKIIGYGSDLTHDGFIKKMKSWANNPIFLNALKKHLTEE